MNLLTVSLTSYKVFLVLPLHLQASISAQMRFGARFYAVASC
jgi:hypothetical protein